MMEKEYYYLRKSCCSGKVYGKYTVEELKELFGFSKDETIKNINDLERRLTIEYKGFDVPYYIERV